MPVPAVPAALCAGAGLGAGDPLRCCAGPVGSTIGSRDASACRAGNHIALIKHSSSWETAAQALLLPPQVWVLKRELTWIPFVGWGIRQLRAIAVDRSGGPAAVRDVIAQGKERLAEGEWVVIFPEGTRMPPGETRNYGVSGALLAVETGRFIVPVAHDAGYYWPRRGWLKKPRHHPRRHRAADRPRGTQSARDQCRRRRRGSRRIRGASRDSANWRPDALLRENWRMKCLVIEDESDTLRYIGNGLREAGYSAVLCNNGLDGMHLAVNESWDLVILDRLLPGGIDGLSIVARLRELGKSTPVLILSALSNTDERVRGLKHGGDDYISKPFAFSELLARVEALLRRSRAGQETAQLQVADLTLDTRNFRVARGTTPIALQPRELRLLAYLMSHEDQVLTRTMLLEAVWDCHFDPQTNVIDVQISRLRSKIDRGFSPPLIHTVRGVGYLLGLRA